MDASKSSANSAIPKPHPRVGVAAVIMSDGAFVFGKRKGHHGSGQWAFPGGHLEYGESFFACAEREALEETGIVVKAEKVAAVTNDVFDAENKHYITIFVLCRRVDAREPQLLEPDKCEGWGWKTWAEVREMARRGADELFLPIVDLLREHADAEALFS